MGGRRRVVIVLLFASVRWARKFAHVNLLANGKDARFDSIGIWVIEQGVADCRPEAMGHDTMESGWVFFYCGRWVGGTWKVRRSSAELNARLKFGQGYGIFFETWPQSGGCRYRIELPIIGTQKRSKNKIFGETLDSGGFLNKFIFYCSRNKVTRLIQKLSFV
mgnify:FL=1